MGHRWVQDIKTFLGFPLLHGDLTFWRCSKQGMSMLGEEDLVHVWKATS